MCVTYIMISWHVVICCLLQLSKPQLQHVLLPLHHRSLQVLLAWAEPDPEIFLCSTHGIVILHQMILISITIVDNLNSGAWLGLVALCARNFHASQRLLLRLPLSLCCQVFFCSFFLSRFFLFFTSLTLDIPMLPVFVCVGFFSPSLTPALPLCVVVTTKFCGFLVYCFSFRTFFLRFPVLHLQRVSNGKDFVEVILWKWENMKGHIVYTTCHTYQMMYL